MDAETRDVWRGGKLIDLTPAEYKLLQYLLSDSKRVLTRAPLIHTCAASATASTRRGSN